MIKYMPSLHNRASHDSGGDQDTLDMSGRASLLMICCEN
jgi:hypothetical protein